jgi:hypothetical protein
MFMPISTTNARMPIEKHAGLPRLDTRQGQRHVRKVAEREAMLFASESVAADRKYEPRLQCALLRRTGLI